jgi:hypothetical protein
MPAKTRRDPPDSNETHAGEAEELAFKLGGKRSTVTTASFI